jgi:hypothetical protein
MLKEPMLMRWKTFLQYYMPEIYKIDRFTSSQYKPEHISEAEEAAPKETWKAPTSLEKWVDKSWDFEVRW